jgi:hypothetical protein
VYCHSARLVCLSYSCRICLLRAIASSTARARVSLHEAWAQLPWLVKRNRASVRARVSRISQASCAVSGGVALPANTPTV